MRYVVSVALCALGCGGESSGTGGTGTSAPPSSGTPFAATSTPGTAAPSSDGPSLVAAAWDDGLDASMAEQFEAWRIPGASVAIITPDGDIVTHSFGVKEGTDLVDADTVFALNSVSKTITAAAIGRLVDAGKVGWDDPVVDHFRGFAIGDPYFNKHITIRDLLSHRSGLGEHAADPFIIPRIMGGKGCTLDELFRWMRTLKPAHGLREKAAYSNIGFNVLARVIEEASGKSYGEFLKEELFVPLGMRRTVIGYDAYERLDNRAAPHDRNEEGVMEPVPELTMGECSMGTGNVYSSARDMTAFLRMLLGEGMYEGNRILETATVAEMLSPHMLVPSSPFGKEHLSADFNSYGLGWEVTQHKGATMVRMGGVGRGFQSVLMIAPREGFAFVGLQNFSPALFHVSVGNEIADRFLGATPTDWTAAFRKIIPAIPDRTEVPIPADSLEGYAGKYILDEDKEYARSIVVEDGKLILLGILPFGLGPPGFGRARLFGLEPDVLFIKTADAVFRFRRDADGAVAGFDETYFGEHSYTRAP